MRDWRFLPPTRGRVWTAAGFIVTAPLLLCGILFGGPAASGAISMAWSAPPLAPHAHDLPIDYEPVHKGHFDLGTGLYVREDDDIVLGGTPPFILRRTYRTNDRRVRSFGIGATHSGEWYLRGDGATFQWAELILDGGERIRFDRVSPGSGIANAIYESWATPTEFFGARLGWTGIDWVLEQRGGAVGRFLACGPSGTVCTISRWRDADGHDTRYTRDENGLLRRIDAGTQWVAFDYDALRRVTSVHDDRANTVTYQYDAAGRLREATSKDGTRRTYAYDASDQMIRIEEPGRIVENQYDEQGLCVWQRTQLTADPARHLPGETESYFLQAAYVKDGDRVVQTDVLESGAPPTRYTFTAHGYKASVTYDPDTAHAIAVTYDRDPGTDLISGVSVTCGEESRWRVARSVPTRPGEEEQAAGELIARWCRPHPE